VTVEAERGEDAQAFIRWKMPRATLIDVMIVLRPSSRKTMSAAERAASDAPSTAMPQSAFLRAAAGERGRARGARPGMRGERRKSERRNVERRKSERKKAEEESREEEGREEGQRRVDGGGGLRGEKGTDERH